MLHRRARVKRTPDGWVVTLAGGSVSKPLPSWRTAYDYAHGHTVLFRAYWRDKVAEPCS